MNKVDFPIGVELPLRGGGVAVLYEFFEGRWYGRCSDRITSGAWECGLWRANGDGLHGSDSPWSILPLKRKAWVVWGLNGARAVFENRESAAAFAHTFANFADFVIQEITEP